MPREQNIRSTDALSRAGHANYFTATFKALAEGKPPPITAEHARHNLCLIHAAHKATTQRKAVDVTEL